MPRLSNSIPPGAQKKYNKMNLHSDSDNYNITLYVREPLGSDDEGGSDNYVETKRMVNFLNTSIRTGTTTEIPIPTKVCESLGTENGTIKARIVEGTRAPRSTVEKGSNTIDWLQNTRNLVLELETSLPDDSRMLLFYFSDPTKNQIPIVSGESQMKIGIRTFFKGAEHPKIDHLNTENDVLGETIELIGDLDVFLQNDETGSNLFLNWTTEPVKPSNTRFIKITFSGPPMLHNFEISSNNLPITFSSIDEVNKGDYKNIPDELISDDWYIDLADPRSSLDGNSRKPLWRSTMSGEIHNKFRIFESLFVDLGGEAHFHSWSDSYSVIQVSGDVPSLPAIVNWNNVMPNSAYAVLEPKLFNFNFSDEILDAFRGGNAGDAPTPWYSEFSFFENLYSEKGASEHQGNPKWSTSNAFLSFDVQLSTAFDASVSGLIVSDPSYRIENPNLSKEDYKKLKDDALNGSVNINGKTFSGWPTSLESVDKADEIYNWTNNTENKKYIVLTPKLDYISRYKKLMDTGGQKSNDNDVYVKVSKAQIASARHPFPDGSGSVDIQYDPDIFVDLAYADKNGWPINNTIVLDVGYERPIDRILINAYAGIKYRLDFYDENYNNSIGVNEIGEETVLPPTIISAGNIDTSNNPLKSSVEIIYGLSSATMKLKKPTMYNKNVIDIEEEKE